MRHHEEHAHRPPPECVPRAEVLEDRQLLSVMGPPSIPSPAYGRLDRPAEFAVVPVSPRLPEPDRPVAREIAYRSAEGSPPWFDRHDAAIAAARYGDALGFRGQGADGGPGWGATAPPYHEGEAVAFVSLGVAAPWSMTRASLEAAYGPAFRTSESAVPAVATLLDRLAGDADAAITIAKGQEATLASATVVAPGDAGAAARVVSPPGGPVLSPAAALLGRTTLVPDGSSHRAAAGGVSGSRPGGAVADVRSVIGGVLALVPLDVTPGSSAVKGAERLLRDWAAGRLEGVPPLRADLLTNFLPFDRTSLAQAIDRFLGDVGVADRGTSPGRGTTDLPTEVLAAAVALTSSKLLLKVLGRSPEEDSDPELDPAGPGFGGVPGFPHPWGRDEP